MDIQMYMGITVSDMTLKSLIGLKIEQVAKQCNISSETVLPRITPDGADGLAKKFETFVPKDGTPNVNDLFPNANRMMFQTGSKWLCPYPCSPTSGGFVEGQGGDSDLIFIPEPFESLEHALIAMDRASEKWPSKRGYSRSVFATHLSERGEEYYSGNVNRVQEFLDFQQNVDQSTLVDRFGAMDMRAVGQLSQNIQYRLFCPQVEAYYRSTKEDVERG